MGYKTILVNIDTYKRVSAAKRMLSERRGRKLSFGGLFDEIFGKSVEFLNIDEALRNYIKRFCERLGEEAYVVGILLFGSVARGAGYNRYSDIDLLVVVRMAQDTEKAMDRIHRVKKELDERVGELASMRLPAFISPIVLDERELGNFRPIYLDFLDYGIVLFERESVLTNFLSNMRRIKHWREFRPYEVLRWQK